MPGSSEEGKPWMLAHYLDMAPATVVDIGPGVGTYANLMRPEHHAHWTGMEIFAPYIERYDLASKYDEIVVGDAREVDLPTADLYIAGDVVEHLTRPDGAALIERMKAAAKHLLVSVPIVRYEQGEWGGNIHEAHLHHWTDDEMIDVLQPVERFKGELLGCYRWDR